MVLGEQVAHRTRCRPPGETLPLPPPPPVRAQRPMRGDSAASGHSPVRAPAPRHPAAPAAAASPAPPAAPRPAAAAPGPQPAPPAPRPAPPPAAAVPPRPGPPPAAAAARLAAGRARAPAPPCEQQKNVMGTNKRVTPRAARDASAALTAQSQMPGDAPCCADLRLRSASSCCRCSASALSLRASGRAAMTHCADERCVRAT